MKPIPTSRLPYPSIALAITNAEITVIGPVGPLTWVDVPPKMAAKIPMVIAP